MSAPTVQTDAERAAKFTPLRVENGRVAEGPYEGATVSHESRWDCVTSAEAWRGQPCFWLDGYLVHNPRCQFDHEQPPEPLPNPSRRYQRLIDDAELYRDGYFDPFDGCPDYEALARQRAAHRGADAL